MFAGEGLAGLIGLEHHALVEPPVEQHSSATADFWYDTSLDQDLNSQLDNLMGSVEQTLASAHELTGVTQARNDYGFLGHGQTVAVIDSGIAWDHPNLGGGFGSSYRVVGGWDFTEENDANPYDDGPAGSHGTHVAGIVGATANSSGDVGVAPGVDLVALRVFNDQGAGYFNWVENALRWVHQNRDSFANSITAVNLSLGTAWNSATLPNWAMLEDEFKQLEADGIFISVSAGNSFAKYNAPGLSYPAASSHVVPVMSVEDNGSLSNFSQRHSRAIAAPGRSIRSTVPDYVGNQNGKTDDWANFSGTSMASPYVAGASVLIREAMQFVGLTNITQDTIYDHLLATADQFFDAATSQFYKRINVSAALDALMPDDDFGNTDATAHSLGVLGTSNVEVNGMIGKLDDVDCFKFTASASGTVTFTAATTHGLQASWSGDGAVGADDNTYTLNVVAGQTYSVGLSTSSGIGYFDLTVMVESEPVVVDWGTVRSEIKSGLNVEGQAWYRISASQSGYVTAKLLRSTANDDVQMAWYDANMQPLANRLSAGSSSRVDSHVNAGDDLYLSVTGNCSNIDIQIVNQVVVDGSIATITGTSAADQFSFSVGSTQWIVSVNGVVYELDRTAVSQTNIDGGDGADRITMTGTANKETAVLRPHDVTFSGAGFTVVATAIENVTLDGLAGVDTSIFYDSAGNDTLTARPESTELKGDNYSNVVAGFECNVVHSVAGGYDFASLFDSAGNDTLTAYAERVGLQGNSYWNVAVGFDCVVANATQGGQDRATLYDSAGNDTFTAYPARAAIQGSGFLNVAAGFDFVAAHSVFGGNDRAVMYDSAGNDVFTAHPDRVGLQGNQFWNVAVGFDCAVAYSTAGGYDCAIFYDSIGDDVYSARPDRALLLGNGFLNVAVGFRQTIAYSIVGGNDRAELYDSAGDDLLVSRASRLSLGGSGYLNIAAGFRRANAFAVFGGLDRAELNDSQQDESILAALWGARLCGSTFQNEVRGFDEVLARRFSDDVRTEVDSTDYVFTLLGGSETESG
jgi:hypothetical protein